MTNSIDIRGAIHFKLGEMELQMTPSFKNLATMERILGRGSLMVFNDFRTGNVRIIEVATLIATLARPVDKEVKLPKGWGVDFVGDIIMDSGFDEFIGVVARWLNAAMSARPKHVPEVDPGAGSVETNPESGE